MVPRHSDRDTQGKWNLRSLIDLEIEVAADEQSGATTEELNQRDQEIGREIRDAIKRGEISKDDRRSILARWLAGRKRNPGEMRKFSTLGESIARSFLGINLAAFVFLVLGFVYGWGVFNIELADSGGLNVYVTWFLAAGLPLLLTLVSAAAALPFVRSKFLHESKPLISALVTLLDRLWRLAPSYKKWRDLTDSFRVRLVGSGGILGTHLASVLHLFGLAMVLGIALAIQVFKGIEDQTYGWQSHNDRAAETITDHVATVATFWAWIEPVGAGYPSEPQVRASQLPISQERMEEARAARMPWIRFLWWSAVFYGVIPRLLLWSVFFALVRWRLRREEFRDLIFQDLCRRLVHPSGGFTSSDQTDSMPDEGEGSESLNASQSDDAILLVPAEFPTETVAQRIRPPLAGQHGLTFARSFPLPSLPGEQDRLFAKLASELARSSEAILLLQLSFRPPTEAFSDVIKALRARFGERTSVLVILIGDLPESESPENVTERHLAGWSRFIRNQRNPDIRCYQLDLTPVP